MVSVQGIGKLLSERVFDTTFSKMTSDQSNSSKSTHELVLSTLVLKLV